jgi:hypothetical protein
MSEPTLAYYWAEGFEFWFWLIVFVVACSYGFISGLNSEPYDFSFLKECWSSTTLPNRPKATSLGEKLLNPEATSEPEDTKTSLTDQSVIDDAVSGLVNLGYKRKQVLPLVLDLVEVKQYDNPESLVKDVFKHAKK